MAPTPVIAEYLIPFDEDEQREQMLRFEEGFFVPSFDIPSSMVAAQLEHDRNLIRTIRNGARVDRNSLRIDAQIVAIAIVHGAEKIITDDIRHFKKLAQDRIPVQEVPEVHEQQDLFRGTEGLSDLDNADAEL